MDIALAVIYHPHTNALLIARRSRDAHQGGLWEFPGGKCLAGETPDVCALRETLEETGVIADILEVWPTITHAYAERTVTLHPFLCRARDAHALPLASQEVRWVASADLEQYDFPSANVTLLARLRGEQPCLLP